MQKKLPGSKVALGIATSLLEEVIRVAAMPMQQLPLGQNMSGFTPKAAKIFSCSLKDQKIS